MNTGERLLKAIFEIGLKVDNLDELTEGDVEDLPTGALRTVAEFTSGWWSGVEGLHQKLHGEYDIPMNPEYCGEDPRNLIGLKEWEE